VPTNAISKALVAFDEFGECNQHHKIPTWQLLTQPAPESSKRNKFCTFDIGSNFWMMIQFPSGHWSAWIRVRPSSPDTSCGKPFSTAGSRQVELQTIQCMGLRHWTCWPKSSALKYLFSIKQWLALLNFYFINSTE